MLKSRLLLSLVAITTAFLAASCTPQSTSTPESPPESSTETAAPQAVEPTASPSVAARSGSFVAAEHDTQGTATLSRQDGIQTLVFDAAFSTSDGPDLVVVLHRSADPLASSTPPAYPLEEADYVVLAPLAATNGSQEYAIPAEVNADDYQSVAVWCQQFNATFGVATLN